MIEWLRAASEDPTIDLAGRKIPIELKRHSRAKRLTLRVAGDASAVRITMPHWCSSREAVDFAHARIEWLEEQLAKIPTPQDPIERGTIFYRGEEASIAWRPTAPRRAALVDGTVRVGGPQDQLAKRLLRWLEAEAHNALEQDLLFFCERAEQDVPQLRLTRAKRRWGSCSSKGVVRINWRLIQAPDFVRRSVVAHEVTHLTHFDHSPAFHAALKQIFDGDIDHADAWLRHNGRTLYRDFG